MASVRKTPTGNWELTIRHQTILGKGVRIFFTFDTEEDAKIEGQKIEEAFAEGAIPRVIRLKLESMGQGRSRQAPKTKGDESLGIIIRSWIENGGIARTDLPVLTLLRADDLVASKRISEFSYPCAEDWVKSMKIDRNYAPGTIRKRIGSLSRCIDWWLRRHPFVNAKNSLQLLPKGSASYSQKDALEVAKTGGRAKKDVARDRRFRSGEIERIRDALSGVKRKDRERALSLTDRSAFTMLFWLILCTGMRLREAYRIERGWIDLHRAVINIRSSKQWHGEIKTRDVPIQPALMELMRDYMETVGDGRDALIFPFINGEQTEENLDRTTNRLSRRFASLFSYADCPGMTEHDLRHEATCLWYELRDAAGGWLFRESEIMTIMGWEPGSPMPARYASFRAEDLAQRMYFKPAG